MTYRLELNPSDHRQVLSNFLQVKGEKYDQSSALFTFPSNSNVQKWTEEHSPDLKLVPSDGSDPVEAPSLQLYLHSPTLRLVRDPCFETCDYKCTPTKRSLRSVLSSMDLKQEISICVLATSSSLSMLMQLLSTGFVHE